MGNPSLPAAAWAEDTSNAHAISAALRDVSAISHFAIRIPKAFVTIDMNLIEIKMGQRELSKKIYLALST